MPLAFVGFCCFCVCATNIAIAEIATLCQCIGPMWFVVMVNATAVKQQQQQQTLNCEMEKKNCTIHLDEEVKATPVFVTVVSIWFTSHEATKNRIEINQGFCHFSSVYIRQNAALSHIFNFYRPSCLVMFV